MKKLNIIFVSLLLVGCDNQNNSSSNRYSGLWHNIIAESVLSANNRSVNPFNTVMNLKYFVSDTIANKEAMIEDITSIYQDNVVDLHKKFDRHYRYYLNKENKEEGYYTNVYDVNESLDTNTPVKLNDDTYELLKFSVEYTKYTNGYFNLFVGELTKYWDEYFNLISEIYSDADYEKFMNYEPYYSEESRTRLENIVKAIPKTNEEIDKVLVFNDETKEVTFNSLKDENNNSLGKISISTGGVAKGYATDILKEKLNEKGYSDGYLFSGASSILSLGEPIYNNSKGQYLSVVDPRTANKFGDDKKSAFGVYLKDAFSMSTSGNYTSGKSYWFKDKETGEKITRHHIVNAFTGYPEYKENISSVSIFSKELSAGLLDVFSTTLVNMSVEKGLEFRKKVMNDFNCDFEITYVKISDDKESLEVITTSNFDGTLEKGTGTNIKISYV